MSNSQKILYGCEHETNYIWEVGEYKFNRCPVSSITDLRIFNYIRAYNRYLKGYGPEDSGWMSWPYKFNMIIDMIEVERSKIDKLHQKDRERKAKR